MISMPIEFSDLSGDLIDEESSFSYEIVCHRFGNRWFSNKTLKPWGTIKALYINGDSV